MNDTPENQEPEVSRMSTSRRRALKTGAGAVLVPTIMTITARNAHASVGYVGIYSYGPLKGWQRVTVDPENWETSDQFSLLQGQFELLWLNKQPKNYLFPAGVYYADETGTAGSMANAGGLRPFVAEDWVKKTGP